ncbi:MAG: hypothetical protein KGZ25_01865 [Planctomycetes bacterium]|nr:hypothetical protein [Planctomycetota bacterium]
MIAKRKISFVALLLGCVLVSGAVEGAEWKHVTRDNGLPGMGVQFLQRDADSVWVGTLGGLAVFKNGKVTTVVKGEAVWGILPVDEGRHWIGTDKGILRLERQKTTRSLSGYSVGRIAAFGDDSALAVADRRDETRLFRFADTKWEPVGHFAREVVSDLFETPDGKVWMLMEANGVVVADPDLPPEKWQRHLQGINIASFCRDGEGRVWCGTWGRGIRAYDGEKWEPLLKKEDSTITTIREDGKGHIWAATNANGLWQFDGSQWQNYLHKEGSINILKVPRDGKVYISSQSVCDLRVWTGKQWSTVLEAPTMFRDIVIGPNKKVWAGNTVTGLYVQK